ncbi:MAG TPA: glutathione binding-like protein [Steroidobacteraceae bacterium]|nr:glutathione binding-like protein [Steroidobacteraceae bacterium]
MIELHTTPTANGFKASIMLEEVELPYRIQRYDLRKGEHLRPDFLALNPVGRLPVIVDHAVAGDRPITVYGTAAILLYLAEKTGKLLPAAAPERASAYEWLGIVSSDLAPAYSGQFMFSEIIPGRLPAAIEYYEKLCLRLLAPMERTLGEHRYLAGDEYSIADVIAYPVATVSARRFPGHLDDHPAIAAWAERVGARPAVQRGMQAGL